MLSTTPQPRRSILSGLASGLLALTFGLAPLSALEIRAVHLAALDADLLNRAERVVRAEVVAVDHGSTVGFGRMPWRQVQLRVIESFLSAGSEAGDLLTLHVPGGTVRAATTSVAHELQAAYSHTPTLVPGTTVYVALERRPEGGWTPVDLAAGVVQVHRASSSIYGDPGLILAGSRPTKVSARPEARFRDDLRRALNTSADTRLQSISDSFELLLSPDDLPPTGCGPNGGNPLRWFRFDGGQTVEVLANATGQIGVAGGGFAQIGSALAAWTNDANSLVELRYGGTTTATLAISGTDELNTISFEDPSNQIPGSYPESALLALSVAFFDCSQLLAFSNGMAHPIVELGIVTQDGIGSFLLGNEPDPLSSFEELIAHELGHGLGFADACDGTSSNPCVGAENDALMRGVPHLDRRGARLGTDDRAGLFFLYPNPQGSPPVAPGLLETTPGSTGTVRLQWQDRSVDEFAFDIETRALGGVWTTIASVGRNVTTVNLNDAGVNEPRLYRVRARGPGGASAPSNEVGAVANSAPATCVPDDQILCLNSGRFRVTARWSTGASAGSGQRGDLTDDTGTFWFFDPANVEVVVKVLDACALFERFWIFAGALTDVEAALVVSDSTTGQARVYFNPASTPFQPVQDTDAFASCP